MVENIQNNISPYLGGTQYQPASFYSLKNQVNKLDEAALKHGEISKGVFAALSPIVPIRRISSLPDNIKDGNYTRAGALVGLMAINLPEDSRDIGAAIKQVCKNQLPNYNYKEFQTPFSFFRGTLLEPLVNKMGKWGAKLHEFDKPLYDSKFGELCKKVFDFDMVDYDGTKRFVPRVIQDETGKTVVKNLEVYAAKVEGSAIGKVVGNSLLRIPIISTLVLSAMEIPAIIKAFCKPESTKDKAINGSTQILKSSVNVSSILTGIGVFGSLLKGRGPVGSLIGMGLGSVAGAYASKEIGSKIDFAVDKLRN